MKIIEYLKAIPNFFDWYFRLAPIKRIQFNYIFLLALVLTLFYYNDAKHRENIAALTARIDAVNMDRVNESEKYTKQLEYYTDKFNTLLEMLIQKKQNKVKQVKS
nr:hypothetical protein [uncultured Flavobacterium sp.]